METFKTRDSTSFETTEAQGWKEYYMEGDQESHENTWFWQQYYEWLTQQMWRTQQYCESLTQQMLGAQQYYNWLGQQLLMADEQLFYPQETSTDITDEEMEEIHTELEVDSLLMEEKIIMSLITKSNKNDEFSPLDEDEHELAFRLLEITQEMEQLAGAVTMTA